MARLFGRKERPAPPAETVPEPVVDPELEARRAQAKEISERRPGRPSVGVDRRVMRVNLSINYEEAAQWKLRALGADKTLSRWARETVNDAIARGVDETIGQVGVVDEINRVRIALQRIGSNLNQIARGFNTEAKGGPSINRDEALEQLTLMRAAHDEMCAQLHRIEGEAQ